MPSEATERAYGIAPPSYRLPDATRLGPVLLQVADLARSLEFYETVMGLRPVSRTDTVSALAPTDDDRVVVELHARPGARPMPRRGRLGLYHYAILLPDRPALGAFVRRLSELGVRAGMSDHFVSEAIYLTDPDGLGIEVYRDRPRDQWRLQDRQLAMATEPLDVNDLVAAADGRSWAGMPPGTTIGHVHLHVGALPAAEAFYHRALGLDKVVWSYPGALFMSAGGYHHHLGANTWAGDVGPAAEQDARLLEWTIALPTAAGVVAAADSVKAAGYPVQVEKEDRVLTDPWGTRLRLTVAAREQP
jgi:catechol 2,3-dioxygenase